MPHFAYKDLNDGRGVDEPTGLVQRFLKAEDNPVDSRADSWARQPSGRRARGGDILKTTSVSEIGPRRRALFGPLLGLFLSRNKPGRSLAAPFGAPPSASSPSFSCLSIHPVHSSPNYYSASTHRLTLHVVFELRTASALLIPTPQNSSGLSIRYEPFKIEPHTGDTECLQPTAVNRTSRCKQPITAVNQPKE